MDQPTRLFDFPRYQLAVKPLETMMTQPNDGQGQRLSYSSKSFVEEMDRVSRGLIAKGLQVGDRVALISHNNRCEWNLLDHGSMQAGAVDVPIYPTMTPKDYVHILNHSEARFCFVSNADLYAKLDSVRSQCPALEEVYTFERVDGAKHWSEIVEAGDLNAA